MKTKRMMSLTVLLILISFVITTIISVISLNRVANQNSEDVTKILAGRINEEINDTLSKPIMAARTMSSDSLLKKELAKESIVSEKEITAVMADYLAQLRQSLEFNSSFVVSDKTKRYYSYDGLNKVITPDDGGHDIWYKIFVESGKDYDFDVDTDEVNGNNWTVFINSRIKDENGNLLGVCGVGVVMEDIQSILREFESKYNIKVNLINKQGVVQVDTDSVNIEQAVLEYVISDEDNTNEFKYLKDDKGGYVVTKYMEDFGWYLVIRNNGQNKEELFSNLIRMNIFAFAGILVLLLVGVKIVLGHEKKKLEATAVTDNLTGLPNRNYFKFNMDGNEALFLKMYRSIAIFDIDKFKTINDTNGHMKGDEVLKAVAQTAKNTLGECGQIIRWGGDEFLIMFREDVDKAYGICEEIRQNVEDGIDATISMGVCGVDGNFEAAFRKADEVLYESKKQGRNCVTKA